MTFSISCVTTARLPQDFSLGKKITLPFRIDSVILVDLRKDTTTIDLKIPFVISRKQEWKKSPTFQGDLKAEIMNMISNASYPDGLPCNITLTIKDGYYRIDGSSTAISQYSFFDCIVKSVPANSDRYWNSSAQAYNTYGTLNATQKHAKEMYRITVRNCIYKALQQGETLVY